MTLGELMMEYPQAAEILMEEGVHCVGCGAAQWETIEQGLAGHGRSAKEIDALVKKMNDMFCGTSKKADSKSSEEITVTKEAAKKIKELIKKENKKAIGLRIDVTEGGCSGSQYELDFETKEKKGDYVLEAHGTKVFLTKDALGKLKGAELDYVEGLHSAGFKINNPNAHNTCGCGDSFN